MERKKIFIGQCKDQLQKIAIQKIEIDSLLHKLSLPLFDCHKVFISRGRCFTLILRKHFKKI